MKFHRRVELTLHLPRKRMSKSDGVFAHRNPAEAEWTKERRRRNAADGGELIVDQQSLGIWRVVVRFDDFTKRICSQRNNFSR
jgi:hypothetical protein